MTGGQYSATTPPDAQVGSAFLNQLERPLDIWGVCPGRYTKKNRLTPKAIDEALAQEGVDRRRDMFGSLDSNTLILQDSLDLVKKVETG